MRLWWLSCKGGTAAIVRAETLVHARLLAAADKVAWAHLTAAFRSIPSSSCLATRLLIYRAGLEVTQGTTKGPPHLSRSMVFNGSAEDHQRCDDGRFGRQLRTNVGPGRRRCGGLGTRQVRVSIRGLKGDRL